MEGKAITSLIFVILIIAYMSPVVFDGAARVRGSASNESEQLTYYNSLSDADKANYTSDYAEDGEPPTPWSAAEQSIFYILGLIMMVVVVRGISGD